MRHAGRQRPQLCDPLGPPQLVLKPLPLADITEHDQNSRSLFVDKSSSTDFYIHGLSAERHDCPLEHGALSRAFNQFLDSLSDDVMVIGMEQVHG